MTVTVTRRVNGMPKSVEYKSARDAEMYSGMSMSDNGYAKSKREAQELARELLTNGHVMAGAVAYEIDWSR